MKIIQEFKEFAVKGNMIDIAIGVIIGAAFNKVVDSIVKDIFMPILGTLTGGIDFTDMSYPLTDNSVVRYGKFLQTMVDFFIIALTVFAVVKLMNRLRRQSQDVEDVTISTPKNIELLSDLKTLLKEQNELMKSKSN